VGTAVQRDEAVHMSQPATTATPTFVPQGLWIVDPDASSVRFSVKHLLVATVNGSFGSVAGTVCTDGRSFLAGGVVQVASIDTGILERDERLRGPGFFDAERHPEIGFRASSARAAGDGAWAVSGELEIGGRRAPLTFAATVRDGAHGPRVHATGSLSRRDHGLDWPGLLHSGRAVVGDRVTIELDLELC
jgi:polyisoprenoid-binding protein YceI